MKTDVVSRQPVTPVQRISQTQREHGQTEQAVRGRRNGELAQTAQFHHQAATAQTAEKALRDAAELLNQLRQNARRMVNAPENKRGALEANISQLHHKLMKLQQSSEYQGQQVLHHDLSPRLVGEQNQTAFTIKGLRLQNARHQEEVLRFQFESGSPASVMARISPDQGPQEVADTLTQALKARDVYVEADKFGDLVFSTPKEHWPEIRDGVWMSGSGQILPSGSPIKAQLDPQQKVAEPAALNFDQPQSVRQAVADIDRMLQQVQQALANISKVQKALRQQMPKVGMADNSVIDSATLGAPQNISIQLINNAVPTLLAQANASRHNVTALLEP